VNETGDRTGTPWELRLAASMGGGVPRPLVLVLLIALLITWTVVAWPRLTLPLSGAAPMVAVADQDVVYDGVGLSSDELAGVRGAIGSRPVVMLFVARDPGQAQ
jgi:hypothetical protein